MYAKKNTFIMDLNLENLVALRMRQCRFYIVTLRQKGYMTHMIKLCVPDKYDSSYLDAVLGIQNRNKENKIYEMYGAVSQDLVGNLRSAFSSPSIAMSRLGEHVSALHNSGIRFNCVLNGTLLDDSCYGNDFENAFQRMIEYLVQCKVDSITLSIPYLIRLVKKMSAPIEVVASICLEINNVNKCKKIVEEGATRIVIDRNVNRDFELISKLVNAGGSTEILCNSPCLYQCTEVHYHAHLSTLLASGRINHSEPGRINQF